jgi:histone H1/5
MATRRGKKTSKRPAKKAAVKRPAKKKAASAKRPAKKKAVAAKRPKKKVVAKKSAKKKAVVAKVAAKAAPRPAPRPTPQPPPQPQSKPRPVVRPPAEPNRRGAHPAARTPHPDQVRDMARRIVSLTVANDDRGCMALYAADVESSEVGRPPTRGLLSIREKYGMWRSLVRESKWQARNVWVAGRNVIIEWSGRVTFAATGKTVDFNEVAIHEVENGKIARERYYYDSAIMQNAGPQPAAGAVQQPPV